MENQDNNKVNATPAKPVATKATTPAKPVATKPTMPAKPAAAKATTPAKPVAAKAATPAKPVAAKATTPAKPVVAKAVTPVVATPPVKAVAEVAAKVQSVVEAVVEKKPETPKNPKEKSTFAKVMEAGKATSKIVKKAGNKILGTSIQTTMAIADVYKKAGKKAVYLGKELIDDTTKLGKELIEDTTKIVASNQKNVRETSAKAFKETVETIKESNLIENPLKGMMKSKKK